jgi:hypothetical protein
VLSIDDFYRLAAQQDAFAALVSARVNDILNGTAKSLEFPKTGGAFNTKEQDALIFADLVARTVCANLGRGKE